MFRDLVYVVEDDEGMTVHLLTIHELLDMMQDSRIFDELEMIKVHHFMETNVDSVSVRRYFTAWKPTNPPHSTGETP